MSETQKINVIARIRPLFQHESLAVESVDKNKIILHCPKQQSHIRNGKKHSSPSALDFDFDEVAEMGSTQNDIFQTVGKPIAIASLSGYNGTIFAYGQTGSGKTFTILGLIPKIFDFLFEEMRKQQMINKNIKFEIKISCLEIYNETLKDLLDKKDKNHNNKLKIREDVENNRFYVDNIKVHSIANIEESTKLLKKCVAHRKKGSTKSNANSSRSHFLMNIIIERKETTAIDGENSIIKKRTSIINIVDLAGSERIKDSGASGKTLVEAQNINKSLSALNDVIMELSKSSKIKKHIRYRDTKLTSLLKDSLGGNSLTFMIACISPSKIHLKQTIDTLKFASRAKKITSKISKNVDKYFGNPKLLKCQVEILKKELNNMNIQMNDQKENNKQLNEQLRNINNQMSYEKDNNKKLTRLLKNNKQENEQLRSQLEKEKLEKANTRKLLQDELTKLQTQIAESKSAENQCNYDKYTNNTNNTMDIKENEYNYDEFAYNTSDTEEKNKYTLWNSSNVATISTSELMELMKKDIFKTLIKTEQKAINKERKKRIVCEAKNNYMRNVQLSDELFMLICGVQSEWKKSKKELVKMVKNKKEQILQIIKRNDPQGFVDMHFKNGMVKLTMTPKLLMDLIDNFKLDRNNKCQYQKLMTIRKKKMDELLTIFAEVINPQQAIWSQHKYAFDILTRNKARSATIREKKIKELREIRRKNVLGSGCYSFYG